MCSAAEPTSCWSGERRRNRQLSRLPAGGARQCSPSRRHRNRSRGLDGATVDQLPHGSPAGEVQEVAADRLRNAGRLVEGGLRIREQPSAVCLARVLLDTDRVDDEEELAVRSVRPRIERITRRTLRCWPSGRGRGRQGPTVPGRPHRRRGSGKGASSCSCRLPSLAQHDHWAERPGPLSSLGRRGHRLAREEVGDASASALERPSPSSRMSELPRASSASSSKDSTPRVEPA
jgi:hypothetical protein